MARQLNIQSREHHGAGKRAPWNAIFAGTVMLAILTMSISRAFGVGLVTIDPAIENTVLNGARTSPALWALVALLIGGCVCARRDGGRNRRAPGAPATRAAAAAPEQRLSGGLPKRPANAFADSDP